MGSFVEINDTLQLTKEQGFPLVLNIDTHLRTPFLTESFRDQVFHFHSKPNRRIYHPPSIRTFLVENIKGCWIYWGTCEVMSVVYDQVNNTTSGTFRIRKIFAPDHMRLMFDLIDERDELNYFKHKASL